MNVSRECTDSDKEALVSYVYGEADASERERVEGHLARCLDCRVELEALQGVRGELAAWIPPERSPGFHLRLVPDAGAPVERATHAPPASWRAWGLAAAAVLVMAASAAVANVQVRYSPDGLTITTGWSTAPAQPAAAARSAETSSPWRSELAALEARLRRDLTPSPATAAATQVAAPLSAASTRSDAELLRRVRSLVEESETRQQRELALRVTELMREVETQRRSDLVRIEQGLGQLEGLTGAEAARQREVLNYLVRVSQRQ